MGYTIRMEKCWMPIYNKIEIGRVAQEHGFEVLFLDGNILDQTILSCKNFF